MKNLRLILAIALAAVLILAVGCGRISSDKIQSWEEWLKTPVGDKSDNEPPLWEENKGEENGQKEMTTVELYFVRDGKLVKSERSIAKVEGIGRATMNELFKGPENQTLKSAFPEGTKLNDINITEEGLCTVDISQQLLEIKGSTARRLALGAITNTLGQFPTVKRVRVLVNGEQREGWTGPWMVGEFN